MQEASTNAWYKWYNFVSLYRKEIYIIESIVKSIAKTNRLLVIDEDVPGGASSFIMQHILDTQNGYQYLDSKPQTLTAKQHRPAYGTDGDYFSKPQVEDVFEKVYDIMNEVNPNDFPKM